MGALEGHWATFGLFFSEVGKKLPNRCVLEAKVGQRRPKWIPEGIQNRPKNDRNIDLKFDGCFCHPFCGFWTIFDAKMEPKWDKSGHQNGHEREKASIAEML